MTAPPLTHNAEGQLGPSSCSASPEGWELGGRRSGASKGQGTLDRSPEGRGRVPGGGPDQVWGCSSSVSLSFLLIFTGLNKVPSLVAQLVKNPRAMQETRVISLGREAPLEEGVATHSTALAWEIPWTEEPGGLQSMGSQRVGHD